MKMVLKKNWRSALTDGLLRRTRRLKASTESAMIPFALPFGRVLIVSQMSPGRSWCGGGELGWSASRIGGWGGT